MSSKVTRLLASVFSHFPTWWPGPAKEPTPANLRALKIAVERRRYAAKGGNVVSRQQLRRAMRLKWYEALGGQGLSRKERRQLATAYAAGDWKEMQGLPKAA